MPTPPLHLVHKIADLNDHFLALIKDLQPEEWQAQTIAKQWKVKDVVAHLLDGNIRILSMLRDDYYGESIVYRFFYCLNPALYLTRQLQ